MGRYITHEGLPFYGTLAKKSESGPAEQRTHLCRDSMRSSSWKSRAMER